MILSEICIGIVLWHSLNKKRLRNFNVGFQGGKFATSNATWELNIYLNGYKYGGRRDKKPKMFPWNVSTFFTIPCLGHE